jgi:hypothetical protein
MEFATSAPIVDTIIIKANDLADWLQRKYVGGDAAAEKLRAEIAQEDEAMQGDADRQSRLERRIVASILALLIAVAIVLLLSAL